MNNWLNKWPKKIIEEWKKFITPNNSSAGKMNGMVKTHKNGNPVRVITSGCNTAIEKLFILVEKTLYPIVDNLPSKIKDTNNMLEIIDQLNEFALTDNFVLVSFDAVNMFPSIGNRPGLESVKNILSANKFDMDFTQCIVEALEICLTCNNSKFNDQNFLQTDGAAQGPHMSCSYADIVMAKYDFLVNQLHLKPKIWKRFRDDIFTLWEHGVDTLPSFLDYLNGMDTTGKINLPWKLLVKMVWNFWI